MKKFKEEDLILYLYNECPEKLRQAIEQQLDEDIVLQDQLSVLRRTIQQLDKLQLQSPSRHSVKAIMKYARESGTNK